MVHIGNDWDEILKGEFEKEYYLKLREFLKQEYSTRRIFPDMYDIFNALKYTPLENVKAVILGQDPYHGFGQAHGLCFSVKRGVEPPPSLKNIYKEISNQLHVKMSDNGCLIKWARQGVLLLNTVLTVKKDCPNSHKDKGWEIFTDHVIEYLDKQKQPMVFMLWGNNAKSKMNLLKNKSHLVLTAAHPSPLSAYHGFFGNNHFVLANQYLTKNGLEKIDWRN